MENVEQIEKQIKSLKGKISRLEAKNKALAVEFTQLTSIPEEKRTTLINLRISEIKLDTGNNNLKIFEHQYTMKELKKELEKQQSQAQPS